MSEPDSIGEAVSGAMLGRAVEPKAGEVGADGHTHELTCLNCGTALQGDFCHACGQHARVHRTLTAFVHDLLHGVLHLDGKVWRTLPMLVRRPGVLTRRYIDGERAKFISPLALFLFSIFLMFAVLTSTLNLNSLNVKSNVSEARSEEARKIRSLEERRDQAEKSGQLTGQFDDGIASARDDLEALDAIAVATPAGTDNLTLSSDFEWLRGPITRSIQNPDLLLYKIRTSAYKWSWMLIPLSVPFLWLLFPFSRRFRLYDHVVFVTYSLSFMTLLVVVASIFGLVGIGWVGLFALIAVPVHFYLQLKGAYGLSRFGALWRTVALSFFAIVALCLFAILMIFVGVL
ncbi:MAG: DUF3667 domain-containing protein [Sphingomicrobium sp.]